jgi:hypothetical protein
MLGHRKRKRGEKCADRENGCVEKNAWRKIIGEKMLGAK